MEDPSSDQQQQQQLVLVNIDTAEFIISFASKKNGTFKSMMHYLRQVEEQLQTRQKKIKIFNQIVDATRDRYRRKIYANRQLVDRIYSEIDYIEHDMNRLTSRRTSLKQELEEHEEELNDIREYAEQRRNKKSKRERQYHQLYNIPIVATQYKKKYVRARDKNSDAEEKVSEVRATVDSCQRAISEISKTLTDCQKKREVLIIQQQDVEATIKKDEELLFNLQEGSKYWTGFNQHQSNTAAKAITGFIETIQRHLRNHNNTFHKINMDPNNDFVKIFRLALYEYGEGEKYAKSRWDHLQIEYDCAKCHIVGFGWPKPDKVRSGDLLCDVCYQHKHTSMMLEKKFKKGIDRSSQLLSLPGGSALSFSSQSTATSDTSSSKSSGSGKPGFKKVIQMLKGGRRSSSSNSFKLDSPDAQRHQMMTA